MVKSARKNTRTKDYSVFFSERFFFLSVFLRQQLFHSSASLILLLDSLLLSFAILSLHILHRSSSKQHEEMVSVTRPKNRTAREYFAFLSYFHFAKSRTNIEHHRERAAVNSIIIPTSAITVNAARTRIWCRNVLSAPESIWRFTTFFFADIHRWETWLTSSIRFAYISSTVDYEARRRDIHDDNENLVWASPEKKKTFIWEPQVEAKEI